MKWLFFPPADRSQSSIMLTVVGIPIVTPADFAAEFFPPGVELICGRGYIQDFPAVATAHPEAGSDGLLAGVVMETYTSFMGRFIRVYMKVPYVIRITAFRAPNSQGDYSGRLQFTWVERTRLHQSFSTGYDGDQILKEVERTCIASFSGGRWETPSFNPDESAFPAPLLGYENLIGVEDLRVRTLD